MTSLTRCIKSQWNYIRVAIVLYLVCFVSTVAWLNKHRKSPLFWVTGVGGDSILSSSSHLDSNVDVQAANVKIPSKEILNIVTPKRALLNKVKEKYVLQLLNDSKTFCGGDFVGYGHVLAKLSNVLVDPRFAKGRIGGENITQVIKQTEDKEYYTLEKGYFSLKCSGNIDYTFKQKSHLQKWLSAVNTVERVAETSVTVPTWTMAVMRYEYANLYHTMTDFYSAFLVTRIFNLDPDSTNVLWVDGHPWGALDSTWGVLFGNVSRVGGIKEPMRFQNLVWSIMGYDSIMNEHHSPYIPYTEEFREFFLSRHGIATEKELRCQKLNIMFLWRRDYLAHPRNPSGHVSRKIKNEEELLVRAKELLPGHPIEGRQIDNLTMSEQLRVVSGTDILIGMHGAGLTHTLFLPRHGGVIELFPTYWSSSNRHFRAMCQWRGLHYSTWTNRDPKRELDGHYTVVDVDTVMKMLHEMHHKMCGDDAGHH